MFSLQAFTAAPRFTAAGIRAFSRTAARRSAKNPYVDGEFVKERAKIKAHAKATTDLWKKISIWVCIPALGLGSANAYRLWTDHWEHWTHLPALEDRVEYSYQNIRTKNFCWGDGDKTLFWNESVNYHNHDKVK